MVNQDNVFDLWDVFVNELIGDVGLTIIIGLAFIFYFGIKFKMPFEVQFIFAIFFLAIIYAQSQIFAIWVFICLIIGTIYYYTVSKMMN